MEALDAALPQTVKKSLTLEEERFSASA